MKSIEITCHASSGTGNGCKSPGYRALSGFACWQMVHSLTKVCTDLFMPRHANNYFKRRSVTGMPEWPPNGQACSS